MTKPKKQKILAEDTFDVVAFPGYDSPCGLDDTQIKELLETALVDSADYLEQNNQELRFLMGGVTEEYLKNDIFNMTKAHHQSVGHDVDEPIQRYDFKLTISLEITPKESYHVEYAIPKPEHIFKLTKVKK